MKFKAIFDGNLDGGFDGNLDGEFVLYNNSDIPICPEILIKKQDDGDVLITNLNTGQHFEIVNLLNNDIYYFNNDEMIFDFICGENLINVSGACQLKFRYREKYLPHGGPIIEEEDEEL